MPIEPTGFPLSALDYLVETPRRDEPEPEDYTTSLLGLRQQAAGLTPETVGAPVAALRDQAQGLVEQRAQLGQQFGLDISIDEAEAQTIGESIAAVVKAGGDAELERNKWSAAVYYARMDQKDIGYAYLNLDAYNKAFYNKGFAGASDLKAIQNGWRLGQLTIELGYLGDRWQELGGADPKIESRIAELTAESEKLSAEITSIPRHWLIEWLVNTEQSIPFTVRTTIHGLATAAMGGIAAPAVAAAGAAGAVAPETAGKALSMLQSFSWRMGSFEESRRITTGLEYIKQRHAGVRHEIAAPVSGVSSVLQSIVEVSLGMVPGLAGRLGGQTAQTIAGRLIEKLAVSGAWGTIARKLLSYLGELPENAVEEFVQDLTSSGALALSRELQGYGVQAPTADQVARSAWENFKAGFEAAAIMGIPSMFLGLRADAKQARVLKADAKQLDRETFVDEKVEHPPEMLDGLDEEQQKRALGKIWDAQNPKPKETEQKAAEVPAPPPAAGAEASPQERLATVTAEVEQKRAEAAKIDVKAEPARAVQAQLDLEAVEERLAEAEKAAAPVEQRLSSMTREEWLAQQQQQTEEETPQKPTRETMPKGTEWVWDNWQEAAKRMRELGVYDKIVELASQMKYTADEIRASLAIEEITAEDVRAVRSLEGIEPISNQVDLGAGLFRAPTGTPLPGQEAAPKPETRPTPGPVNLAQLSNLPPSKVEQFPSGRWGYGPGRARADLMYERMDGAPITDEDAARIQQNGPGATGVTYQRRTWATEQEARNASEEQGAVGMAGEAQAGPPQEVAGGGAEEVQQPAEARAQEQRREEEVAAEERGARVIEQRRQAEEKATAEQVAQGERLVEQARLFDAEASRNAEKIPNADLRSMVLWVLARRAAALEAGDASELARVSVWHPNDHAARRAYDYINKIMPDGGDGFGRAVRSGDGSQYRSPAGTITLAPPHFKGERWRAIYDSMQDLVYDAMGPKERARADAIGGGVPEFAEASRLELAEPARRPAGPSPEPAAAPAPEPATVNPAVPHAEERPTTTIVDPRRWTPVWIDVSKIIVSEELFPNFKEGANERGILKPINAKRYIWEGTAPIVVYERLDGKVYIATGRHRLDLLLRTGEKQALVQVLQESEGLTPAMVKAFDAEANIRDGQGTVRDYVEYFRATELDEQGASERVLLATDKGRAGFLIGHLATEHGLYTAFRNHRLSAEKAAVIADVARGDLRLEELGLRRANDFGADELYNFLDLTKRQVVAQAPTAATQGDLFGHDDSLLIEQEQMGRTATARIQTLKTEYELLRKAVSARGQKQADALRRFGYRQGDVASVRARLVELEPLLEEWKNWASDPTKVREIRIRAGLTVPEITPKEQAALATQYIERDGESGDLFGRPEGGTVADVRASYGQLSTQVQERIDQKLTVLRQGWQRQGVHNLVGLLGNKVKLYELGRPGAELDQARAAECIEALARFADIHGLMAVIDKTANVWTLGTAANERLIAQFFGRFGFQKNGGQKPASYGELYRLPNIRNKVADIAARYEVAVATMDLPEISPKIAADQAGRNQRILDAMGETTDPRKAGYVLTDGRMVDLGGAESRERVQGHSAGLLGYRDQFMAENGAVRFDYGHGVVHFSTRPSAAQIETLARVLEGQERARIEVSARDGKQIAFAELGWPTATRLVQLLAPGQVQEGRGELDVAFGGEERAEAAGREVDQLLLDLGEQFKAMEGRAAPWEETPGVSLVANDWKAARHVNLRGLWVPSVRTLAEAFSVFRSQTVEAFHIVYAQRGNVLANNCYCAGLQASVPFVGPGGMAQFLYEVQDRVRRLGATEVYLVHNHPSGQIEPSWPDRHITQDVAEAIPQLRGHVVLDGDKFTLIDRDGGATEHEYRPILTRPDTTARVLRRPEITGAADVADLAHRLHLAEHKNVVIVCNWHNRVLAWVPVERSESITAGRVHQIARQMGGSVAFVATNSARSWREISNRLLATRTETVDVVLVHESGPHSAREELDYAQGVHPEEARAGRIVERKSGSGVFEPETPYGGVYQDELFADLHEESVFTDVVQGEPVPDRVLASYSGREWAQREMAGRSDLRDDAKALQEAAPDLEADDYGELMAGGDIEGRPRTYYRMIWETAAEPAEPRGAGERFVAAFTKEAAENALHDLGREDFLGALPEEVRRSLEARLAALPEPIRAAIRAVDEAGGLSDQQYQAVMAEVRKDPRRYRLELGGAVATLDAAAALRQRQGEALVDPDISTHDELKRAFWRNRQEIDALKGTVGDVLSNTRTLEQIQARTEQEYAEKQAKRKAREYVQRLVRRIMRPVSGAVRVEYAEKIAGIQDRLVVRGARAYKAVRDQIRAATKPGEAISAEAQGVLDKFIIDELTVDELEALAARVDELRYVGRKLREMQLVEKHHRQWQDRQKVIEVLKSIDPEKLLPVISGSLEHEGLRRGNLQQQAAWFLARPTRWALLLDGGTEGINHDLIVRRENEAQNERARNEVRRTEALALKMKVLGLKPSQFLKIVKVNAESLTINNALAAYMYMKNADSELAVVYGNFDGKHEIDQEARKARQNVETLIGYLTPAQRALGDWMLASFQGADKERLMAFVKEHLNQAFAEVDQYFPMLRRDVVYEKHENQIAADMMAREGVRSTYPWRGMTKKRQKILPQHQLPINLSAMTVFFDAIAKQEHLMAFGGLIEDLYAVYNRRDVRELIMQKFGGQAAEVIMRHIKRIANPDEIHIADSPVDRTWRRLRGNMQVAALTWNVLTAARNHPFVGSWLYLRDAGPVYLLNGLRKIYTNRKEAEAFIYSVDPQMQTRHADPLFYRLQSAQRTGYQNALARIGWHGLRLLEHFDRLTILSGWIACYDMMKATDHSEQEAIEYAREATLKTQPTGEAKDLSEFLDSEVGRFLALFGNQLSNMLNMMIFDLPTDVKRKRIDRILGTIAGFAMTGILMGLIQRKRLPEDLGELALDVASQFLSPTIIGDQIIMLATGKGYYGGGAPWEGMIRSGYYAGKAMFDDSKDLQDKAAAVAKALPDALRFLGGPAVATKRLVSAIVTGDPWELTGGPPEPGEGGE